MYVSQFDRTRFQRNCITLFLIRRYAYLFVFFIILSSTSYLHTSFWNARTMEFGMYDVGGYLGRHLRRSRLHTSLALIARLTTHLRWLGFWRALRLQDYGGRWPADWTAAVGLQHRLSAEPVYTASRQSLGRLLNDVCRRQQWAMWRSLRPSGDGHWQQWVSEWVSGLY